MLVCVCVCMCVEISLTSPVCAVCCVSLSLCTGYVPLSGTKIDFSSDLEKADPNQKKKKNKKRVGHTYIPTYTIKGGFTEQCVFTPSAIPT